MAGSRQAPDFQIQDAGQPISSAVRTNVIQITVDERLNQAASCSIELRDDDGVLSDGSHFKLGSELRVALGYTGATKFIFEGEITGWKGAFPRRGPRTLTVVAHDRFHRLRRERKQRNFLQMKDSEIAQKIAGEYGFSCDAKTSLVKHDYIIQANESDADFLLERARGSGYELFVDGKKLVFRAPRVDGAAGVKLKWHETLKRFAPTISIAKTPTEVKATSYDMKQKKLVTVTARKGDEGGSMGGSKIGAEMGTDAGERPLHIPWMPLLAPDEMEALAKGTFAATALRLVTGEGEAQGDANIRRGTLVNVEAIGDFLSGDYYVDAALHTLLPGHGYTTTFRVKRLALAKPPAPPPAQAPAQPAKGPAQQPPAGDVEFVVTNQFGDPIEGIEYVLTCPDGEKKTGKLPANGIVKEKNAKAGTYTLAIKGVDPPIVKPAEGGSSGKAAGGAKKSTAPLAGKGLEVQITNKVGRPQAGVFWEVTLPDGSKQTGKTDADGWIRIPTALQGDCHLTLPDLEAGGSITSSERSESRGEAKQKLTISIAIDPDEASKAEDKFVLRSTDGAFNATKTIKDDKIPGDGKTTLEFADVDPAKRYTLEVHEPGAEVVKLFEDVPFSQIAGGGGGAAKADDAPKEPVHHEGETEPVHSAFDLSTEVVIHVGMDPKAAKAADDVFILEATDGSYRRELRLKDDHHPQEKDVQLHFFGLDEEKSYTLKVREGEETITLFEGVSYSSIASLPPPEKKPAEPESAPPPDDGPPEVVKSKFQPKLGGEV